MNPDTNKFERLDEAFKKQVEDELEERGDIFQRQVREAQAQFLRPDGSPVPKHWSVFQIGEHIVIKDYTFKVCYIGETSILFEPVGIPDLSGDDD